MEIKKLLTLPYTGIGKLAGYACFLILGSLFLYGAVAIELVASLTQIAIPTGAFKIMLGVASVLMYLPVFGYVGRILTTAESYAMPDFGFGKSFVMGVKLAVITVVYAIPYELSLFVYGPVGIALSTAYLVFLIIFMPAILLHTAQENKIRAGFKWNKIIKRLSGTYALALLLSIVFFALYSFVAWLLGFGLLLLGGTATTFYVVTGVYYLIYLLSFFLAVSTGAALIGSTSR